MHDCFLSYICGEVGDGALALFLFFLFFFGGDWVGGAIWLLPYASPSVVVDGSPPLIIRGIYFVGVF